MSHNVSPRLTLLIATLLVLHIAIGAAERLPQILCHKSTPHGETFDAVAQLGPHPAILLLIHQWDEESATLVTAFDDMTAYYRPLGVRALTVLAPAALAPEVTPLAEKNAQLDLRSPMVQAIDNPDHNHRINKITGDTLLLFKNNRLVKQIPLSPEQSTSTSDIRSWIEEISGPLPIQPQEYLESIKPHLPHDPERLREWVISQSLELHRVHRKMKAATEGIPKYRPRTQMRMQPAMKSK